MKFFISYFICHHHKVSYHYFFVEDLINYNLNKNADDFILSFERSFKLKLFIIKMNDNFLF